MFSLARALLAIERGLEIPALGLEPSHQELKDMLLNLDWLDRYLDKKQRKTLLDVRHAVLYLLLPRMLCCSATLDQTSDILQILREVLADSALSQ